MNFAALKIKRAFIFKFNCTGVNNNIGQEVYNIKSKVETFKKVYMYMYNGVCTKETFI